MRGEILRARVRSVDAGARTALVEMYGSEGVAVPAALADHLHPRLAEGPECLVAVSPSGERTVVATLEHDPARVPSVSAWSEQAGRLLSTLGYSDGATWADAISTTITVLGAAKLVLGGYLALRTSAAANALPFVEVRGALVEGGLVTGAVGVSSALAGSRVVVPLGLRLNVAAGGTYTVKVQLVNKLSGSTITLDSSYLQVEARW